MMGNSFLKGDNVETLIDVEIGDNVVLAGCYAYVMETEPEKDNIYVHVPGFGHTTVHKFDLRLLSHRTPAATPPTGAPAAGEGERPRLGDTLTPKAMTDRIQELQNDLDTWKQTASDLSDLREFEHVQLATLQADNARLADELARARAEREKIGGVVAELLDELNPQGRTDHRELTLKALQAMGLSHADILGYFAGNIIL